MSAEWEGTDISEMRLRFISTHAGGFVRVGSTSVAARRKSRRTTEFAE